MRKYIFIGIGGFFGAISRLWLKSVPIYNYKELIPVNILFINIIGSFILALVTIVSLEIIDINTDIRLGICTGFLGAFTTFSTMCKEIVALLDKGDYFSSLSYITNSIFIGLAAAYFGAVVAREVIGKIVHNSNRLEEN